MEKQTTSGTSGQLQAQSHSGTMLEKSAAISSINSSLQTPIDGTTLASPRTPPDQASIQSSMDKNKETLKRKLMLRRSVNELVDRGIYPPLKTPPAFAEKTKQLERAKTGDLLRHKIQHRPERQLLVQQHILEDTTIDPSLHERQRLLKRSRLLDGLNDKLAHRPGPLELVQGNILQPSRELANAIRDGTIQFVPTCDTEEMDQSSSSFMFDDESAGSDGAPSPFVDESSGLSDVSSPSSAPPVASAESLPISFTFTKGIPVPLTVNKSPQIPLVCSNSTIITASSSTPKLVTSHTGSSNASSAVCNNNNSSKLRIKKPKPKSTSKARIIKFHEYKGPPSVVKSQPSNTSTTVSSSSVEDTPYHIMLQQQQLFLQWQLEFQQKQHQQGSSLSPSATSVGENSSASPAMSPVIVTSPVALASSSPSLAQASISGNVGLVHPVSLHQPLNSNPTMFTQNVLSPVSLTAQTTTQNTAQAVAQTSNSLPIPSPVPPPPPLPPARPTQSVAPRQATKALTSIPASALSLPKLSGNLEDMKVADLKAELKKRSLPVSGPKPQLIERLKPFTESNIGSHLPSSSAPKSNSRPPPRVSTPLQFSQTTFHIKTEPNGEVIASPVTRPIPSTTATSLLTSSSQNVGISNSNFSVPISLPFSTQGVKTVVSVKPMVKEEPMTTTDISPPVSPPTLLASTPGANTPMSPEYDATSPPILTTKLTCPTVQVSQNMLNSANLTNSNLLLSSSHIINSVIPAQTVVSMSTDTTQPTTIVPAEMMPMEVDSVSVDLNQGVDDTAFKAASMGQSMDSADIKALIQQPYCSNAYKSLNLNPGAPDNKAVSHAMDANAVKTINLNTNFDGTAIKTLNVSPNTDPSTIKTINLGSKTDSSPFKTLSLSQSTDASGFKTISISPLGDAVSLLKTVKVPLSQLSPTQMSPVQLTAPIAHTLTSPTSLLQLQQLQQLHTLQQLQQQLIQQTQAHQQQFQQQSLQHPSLSCNDQVVLAQAKQIEELQRQLQESHLKLKLQQLQQQQQIQLQQQQQQQQLWQVQIPSNFAQNSLLGKLSQDQQSIKSQISPVITASLQLQQQQSALVTPQPTASMVQQQPASVFLNGHTIQQTPLVVSGVQQTHIQKQQHQAPLMISKQAMVSNSSSATGTAVSMGGTVTNNSNLVSKASGTGQTSVSLPYAIHINLTNSGQVKLPSQLQPITTSTSATTTTKQSDLPSLQLQAKLLLNQASTNILAAQPVKSEPSPLHSMGPPSTTAVPKSQSTSGHSFVFTSSPSTTVLVPGHTNGVVSRTTSVPSSLVTDQQKQNIQRSSSTPYFSKEPPRYDEAMKIKQQQAIPQVSTSSNNINSQTTTIDCLSKPLSLGQNVPDIKSQTMDDVLEILIRNGELPPSAATEAFTAPKLTQNSADTTNTTSSSCLSVTPSVSPVTVTAQSQPVPFPPQVPSLTSTNRNNRSHLHDQPSTSSANPKDQTLTSVQTSMFSENLLNDTHTSSSLDPDTSGSSSFCLTEGICNSDGDELLGWGEMMPSPDLSNMDWSVESGFGHLDLGDSNLNLDSKISDSSQISQDQDKSRFESLQDPDPMYTSSGSGSNNHNNSNNQGLHTPSMHGSEPDLTVLGLDGDSSEAMGPSSQMDMSEWLDVIMPNSSFSLEHMNIPASMPFSSDPILTPRTRQDVFDIFDFDDPDFGPSGMGWEKLTEQGTSSY